MLSGFALRVYYPRDASFSLGNLLNKVTIRRYVTLVFHRLTKGAIVISEEAIASFFPLGWEKEFLKQNEKPQRGALA